MIRKNEVFIVKRNMLNSIKGKTIAIVYIFEKEEAEGFGHFLIWKDRILTGWLNAVYEIECLPYIIDVRTFMQKASNYSLPHIDYVINLNSGCNELSTMGLVPSICSFLDIPCIPCDATAILATENKKISNYVALGSQLQTPKFLDSKNNFGVYRPINLGNSIGIEVDHFTDFNRNGIYQEFIPGYDVTIPVAFNFITKKIDILPPTLYFPKTLDQNWIFDEKTKEKDRGLTRLQFLEIEDKTKSEIINFFEIFDIKTYGRIDARMKCENKLSGTETQTPFSFKNCYFLEINSMPTIENEDGFDLAFKAVQSNEKHSFYECINEYKNNVKHPTINGFLLATSIIAISTSKY